MRTHSHSLVATILVGTALLLATPAEAREPWSYVSIDEKVTAALPDTPKRLVKSERHTFFELVGHKDLDGGVITFSGMSEKSDWPAKKTADAWKAELDKAKITHTTTSTRIGVYPAVVVQAGPPYNGNPHVVRKLFVSSGTMSHTFSCMWAGAEAPPAAADAYFSSIAPGPKADTTAPGGSCGCTTLGADASPAGGLLAIGALALVLARRSR